MIRIVIPTALSASQVAATYPQNQCQKTIRKLQEIYKNEIDVFHVYENKEGLSKLYNKHLYQPSDFDIVLFLHDDVEVHDLFFIEKLKAAHQKYDIVGLAGAITQKYTKEKPTVWHLCRENQSDARGIVSHFIPKGFNNSEISYYNSAYFGPSPAECCVIDGLFMSVKVKALFDAGVVFDEDFLWHNYDTSFCLRAKQANLKLGVWPIFCVHHGLGEWQNETEWQKADKKFKEKYVLR